MKIFADLSRTDIDRAGALIERWCRRENKREQDKNKKIRLVERLTTNEDGDLSIDLVVFRGSKIFQKAIEDAWRKGSTSDNAACRILEDGNVDPGLRLRGTADRLSIVFLKASWPGLISSPSDIEQKGPISAESIFAFVKEWAKGSGSFPRPEAP